MNFIWPHWSLSNSLHGWNSEINSFKNMVNNGYNTITRIFRCFKIYRQCANFVSIQNDYNFSLYRDLPYLWFILYILS